MYQTKKDQKPHGFTKKKTDLVKIIPLGGLEEIGRNMTLFEYQNQILIIDMGLQFPDENMPGIDFIIPNIEYLTNHPEKKILGVIITHGHYDHIGGIPYLIDKLNYPQMYTAPLTKGIILKRQEDFPNLKKLNIQEISSGKKIILGPFNIIPFHVNHNIPDTLGLAINSPAGLIMYATDFKFDLHPIADKPADPSHIISLASSGTTLLLSDSTGAESPGHSISEKTIMDNLDPIFRNAEGRIILSTFASLLSRVQQAIWLSEKYNRKVIIEGFAMKTNVAIAEKLKYLSIKKGTVIKWQEASRIDPKKLTVLCTGAQGESEAVLMRIVNKGHKYLRIQKKDTVIFSSSVVPGNELAVQNIKDNLAKQGAKVYHYKMLDIHASGHGYQEDLKAMINLVKPKFFMPIHGHYSMLKTHGELAESVNIPPKNIVIATNGQIIELSKNKIIATEKFVPTNYIMVDGLGVGDVKEVVLRARQTLSQDGIFIIVALIDKKTGLLHSNPEIISQGFVYMKESKELINQTRKLIKEIINHSTSNNAFNEEYIRNNLRNKIGLFLFKKIQRRPMILPIVIEV
ncbi:MAG: ribonuclease J [Candidatus Pacebacteria bacterium]|jgi:ribonuclease J|nr:ribonuclease J [Candidatus Paceibacterota bacterium]MDD4994549.1 ribonuclease J [Candidatus Paceibacterota bacterium]MDD5535243.1 ribonuclease J [Candidatus Paceibacterota bacterium]